MDKRYPICMATLSVLLFAAIIMPAFSMAAGDGKDSLEAQSTHVLTGRVKAVESRWNQERTLIYSYVTVKVENFLKGNVKGGEVLVRHLGGEVGAIGQWTEHEPRFAKGERVKLYLKQDQSGVYTVVNGEAGKQSLEAVEFTSPGYNWQGQRWFSVPVSYWLNYAGAPAGTVEATELSFNTWEEDPGSYMDYTMAGTTSKTGVAKDGTNLVFWGYIDGSGSILAVCTFWYWTATNEIIEFDIKMDSGDSWQVWEGSASSGAFDVRNILTHEAGHSLGLLDLYDSAEVRETMYGYSGPGETTKRTLYTGDVKGLSVVYPVTYNLGTTVRMDKKGLMPGWPAQVSLRITTKAIDGMTIGYFWGLIAFGQILPILYIPSTTMPEMFEIVLDVDFATPNLGSATFDAAWIVIIVKPSTGEILAWDYSLWKYVPSGSTAPIMTPGDFAAELAKSISLPS